MSKEKMFLEGNIRKTIFKMSIPIIISQMINVLYNIVDRIYIGNMPEVGKDALAGVGITFPILMIVAAFAALFGMGGAPIATIRLGEGKKEEANKIMNNSFIMLVIIGVILSVILIVFDRELLYLFGAKDEIISYSKSYLNIYTLGSISVMLTLGLNSYITAQGYTKVSMFTVIIGALLNIILDPIFIYLFNLGVAGAAYATIISQTVSAIFIIIFLTSSKPVLKLSFKDFKLDKKIILSVIALGVSPFIMNATESLVQIAFNLQIKAYGGADYVTYINLMTIMLSVMTVIMLPLIGFAQGASPFISYNYGANKPERVKSGFRVILITSIIYTLSFYLIIFFFPNLFVRIFNNDVQLLQIAPRIFRIFFLGISIMGIQIACQNTFMALKQSLVSLILALLRKVVLLIPLTFILPLLFKLNGIFYAEAIADIVAVTITSIVFFISFNKILAKKQNENLGFEKKEKPIRHHEKFDIILDAIKVGLKRSLRLIIKICKIIIPVYFVVSILDYFNILEVISSYFEGVMNLFGLPGDAALVLLLANGINIYASIAVLETLKLTVAFTLKQLTIVALMISISHSLPVETSILKGLKIPVYLQIILRLSVAVIVGILLNLIWR